MNKKTAKELLKQRDPQSRRRLILQYSAVLLLLIVVNGYFSNLSSPLKVIPTTFTSVVMGYVILLIVAVRRFPYVADFIDWAKVEAAAESAHP